jgi:hypothetical protein
MKSAGDSVIPMESMRAASAAVKYSVVNQANFCGDLSAMIVERTVQIGNRLTTRERVVW